MSHDEQFFCVFTFLILIALERDSNVNKNVFRNYIIDYKNFELMTLQIKENWKP